MFKTKIEKNKMLIKVLGLLTGFMTLLTPISVCAAEIPTSQISVTDNRVNQPLAGLTGGLARIEVYKEKKDNIALALNDSQYDIFENLSDPHILVKRIGVTGEVECYVIYMDVIVGEPKIKLETTPGLLVVKYTDVPQNWNTIEVESRLDATACYYYYDKNKYSIDDINSFIAPQTTVVPEVYTPEKKEMTTVSYVVIAVVGLVIIGSVVGVLIFISNKQDKEKQDKQTKDWISSANKKTKQHIKRKNDNISVDTSMYEDDEFDEFSDDDSEDEDEEFSEIDSSSNTKPTNFYSGIDHTETSPDKSNEVKAGEMIYEPYIPKPAAGSAGQSPANPTPEPQPAPVPPKAPMPTPSWVNKAGDGNVYF